MVGAGHVGELVRRYAASWGFRVLTCDPPRAVREGGGDFVPLEEVARHCDLVTFHTPLDATTRRMADEALLRHIAGYSAQGKANATAMAVGAVARRFALPLEGWYPAVAPSHPRPIGWDELAATIGARYDIAAESDTLKRHPERFEALRNGYSYREEYF